MKQAITLLLFLCCVLVTLAQSTRQEAYSDFVSAKNAPYHSMIGMSYYRVEEFNRLGEAAQRLYGLSNQEETVAQLRTANRDLQAQNNVLNLELENLRRTSQQMTAAIAQTTPKVQTNEDGTADEDTADDDTPTKRTKKKKGKTFTDWLIDNALVLILLLAGGSYYLYEKRKKTTV